MDDAKKSAALKESFTSLTDKQYSLLTKLLDRTDASVAGEKTIRSRLFNFLFGEKVGVFVLTPGRTVESRQPRPSRLCYANSPSLQHCHAHP
jgi:hypothetical protein